MPATPSVTDQKMSAISLYHICLSLIFTKFTADILISDDQSDADDEASSKSENDIDSSELSLCVNDAAVVAKAFLSQNPSSSNIHQSMSGSAK